MLAELIYAGSDMFLMPSRYEPCGLGQLISYRFGTIPVVRKTGGLADTVADYSENPEQGTGFVFEKYDSAHLVDALAHAVAAHKKPRKWKELQERVMGLDYSWAASARKYLDLYRQLVPVYS
jgi:starch synthase